MIGAGGVLAELIADRAILMLPTSEAEISAALATLKVDSLLRGYRGKPAADREAVVVGYLAHRRFRRSPTRKRSKNSTSIR